MKEGKKFEKIEKEEKKETYQEKEEKEKKEANERLRQLLDKKVSNASVSDFGDITIEFEDGATFQVWSWNPRDDKPEFENIEVSIPDEKKENKE